MLDRYVIIFWLKNPSIINDDFWSFFLTLWIGMASFTTEFTRYFLPGKQAFAYYLCTGTDPTPGGNVIRPFVFANDTSHKKASVLIPRKRQELTLGYREA
jgi:hypothetical protein